MAYPDIEKKFAAASEHARPQLRGRFISEGEGSVVIKAGDAIVEVPTKHISDRAARGDEIELTLTPDANILVSALVSVQKGFVGDNIFGALVPNILADNCNCNCNCSSIQGTVSISEASRLRRPFTGGQPNVSA